MATTYVETTGLDANAGSEVAPWLTIRRATNQAAGGGTPPGAGDTTYVKNGTYNVASAPSGAETAPPTNPQDSGASASSLIMFRVFPGHVVRINCNAIAANTQDASPCFGVHGEDYVLWDGFRVPEGGTYKCVILADTAGAVLENLYLDVGPRTNGTGNGNYQAIILASANDVADSIIRYCDMRNAYDTDLGGVAQTYGVCSFGGTRLRVHNNEVQNCGQGFEDKWDCTDNIWELNYSHNTYKHSFLVSDLGGVTVASGLVIRYNVATYAAQAGLDDGSQKINWADTSDGVEIYNNTNYLAERGLLINAPTVPTTLQFYNNINVVTDANSNVRFDNAGLSADFRCDFNRHHISSGSVGFFVSGTGNRTLAQWQALTAEDGRTLDTFGAAADSLASGDPVFDGTPAIGAAPTVYKLGGASPCRNAGHVTGLEAGAAVHIGAYYTDDVVVGIPTASITGVWLV